MNWPDDASDWAELGLGPDELALYEALLAPPPTAPTDGAAVPADGAATPFDGAAAAAGLPPQRARAALGALRRAGFVLPAVPGERWPGVLPPATALRSLIQLRQAELLGRSARLEVVSASVDRLAAQLSGGVPEGRTPGIETVRGRAAIAARVQALVASATSELTLLDRPPYTSRDGDGPPAPLGVTELVERGVTVRAVVDREGLDFPGRARELNELADRGVEIRIAADLPTKLIVVDGRISLLPPTDAVDPTASALVVKDTTLHHVLVPLFELVWERAIPIGGDSRDGATAQDREILTLLASGFKDEAIARRLDVHVHTVRRRIKALLLVLDAETRFQAGVQALRRGWLTV
ncbi:helix-turn-helix transcriptional regulator [Kitasatospora phosalacinea]|uniref:Transcriptional regulator n=1 Tax=Kitasatospora phosalacinea TaxID=2065 RepID=A0A9W6PK70_9ACTN|nr:LuxR family transcriptional regulator [Kitasatospora phosalacinea]GLW56317.1 transcriptional regulator [Kitasatospora phosalacinea]